MIVLSFDIDGTMEMGDPPGPILAKLVHAAQKAGFVVGSCSDRPVPVQIELWRAKGITLDFNVMKHRLLDVKSRFDKAEEYYHIGDTELDKQFAEQAGFNFFYSDAVPMELWTSNNFMRDTSEKH